MSPVHPLDDAATARAVVDGDGILVAWSEGARRLLGYAPDEVEGRPAAGLLAPQAQGRAPERADRRWDGVVALRHRDGRRLDVWLLAHHLEGRDDWLLVAPLDSRRPAVRDETLVRAVLAQSPCATAVYDARLRLHGINDAMSRVIGLPEHRIRGLRVSEIGGRPASGEMEREMAEVLASGRGRDVETYARAGGEERAHAWLARIAPLRDTAGSVHGVCVTVHDFTEQFRARERLRLVNEASVRIGTTLDVTRTAQELADVCVPRARRLRQRRPAGPARPRRRVPLRAADRPRHAAPRRPPVGATREAPRRSSRSAQVDVYPASSPQADSLVAGRPLVAPNAGARVEQWLAWDERRRKRVAECGVHAVLSVPIAARGQHPRRRRASPGHRAPEASPPTTSCSPRRSPPGPPSASTTPAATPANGTPRSPCSAACCPSRCPARPPWRRPPATCRRRAPGSAATGSTSSRCPACGSPWSSATSSATASRPRRPWAGCAPRCAPSPTSTCHPTSCSPTSTTWSSGSSSGGRAPRAATGEVGATCLYAVYDPVSRRCTLARAGHPPPVVRAAGRHRPGRSTLPPGRRWAWAACRSSPPSCELAEGSLLALYTDGLVESRERDSDASHRLLLRGADGVRAGRWRRPATRDPAGTAAGGRRPRRRRPAARPHPRARRRPTSRPGTSPADPARVAPVRKQVADRLDALGADGGRVHHRAGGQRTGHQRHPLRRAAHPAAADPRRATLICEVSDASNTAPHLRRAQISDEGGRGLLLVAQLTQRWGTRHTPEGKTIWAELSLPGEE